MRKITIEWDTNSLEKVHCVIFIDDNGQSILAKTRDKAYAQRLQRRFKDYLKQGRLLPTYKSAYKF